MPAVRNYPVGILPKGIRGATKKKLLGMGFGEQAASLMATDRNYGTLESMDGTEFMTMVLKFSSEADRQKAFEDIRPDLLAAEDRVGELSIPGVGGKAGKALIEEFTTYTKSVQGFSIGNFKGFRPNEDPAFLPIRPLTLVYGPNNGGKSSILKGFGSVPQTMQKRQHMSSDEEWATSGPWYNLGSWPQILNNSDSDYFSLGYVYKTPKWAQEYCKNCEVRLFYRINKSDSTVSLEEIHFYTGDFEDYMELEMKLYRQMQTSISDPRETYLIDYVSEEIKQSEDEAAKRSKNLHDTLEGVYRTALETTEDVENIQLQKAYLCPECDHKISWSGKKKKGKWKQMRKHIESEHSKELKACGLGFTQDSKFSMQSCVTFAAQPGYKVWVKNLRLFVTEYESYKEGDFARRGKIAEITELKKVVNRAVKLYSKPKIIDAAKEHGIQLKNWGLDEQIEFDKEGKPKNASSLALKIMLSEYHEREIKSVEIRNGRLMGRYGELNSNRDRPMLRQAIDRLLTGKKGSVEPQKPHQRRVISCLGLLDEMLRRIDDHSKQVDYLSATRLIPQRSYSARTGGVTNQGVTGERTLALLAADVDMLDWVNIYLEEMLGLKLHVQTRKRQFTTAEGRKKTYATNSLDVRVTRIGYDEDRLELPDVGFGVSQLLPVLTAIRSPGTLIIEEPESNLHPAAQQKLMRIMVERARELRHDNILLMETHSEHFLLEVLRSIADPECTLTDDDVSILYVHTTPENGTVVKRHTTTNGVLNERFPREFSGDYELSMI